MTESLINIDLDHIASIDVASGGYIRATCGPTKSGKLVRVNNEDIDDTIVSKEKLLDILKSTNLESLTISENNILPVDSEDHSSDYYISFRNVPNGKLGITVKQWASSSGGALVVVSKLISCCMLSIGDVILSVHGISLIDLPLEDSLKLLEESQDRKLLILTTSFGGSAKNITQPNVVVDEKATETDENVEETQYLSRDCSWKEELKSAQSNLLCSNFYKPKSRSSRVVTPKHAASIAHAFYYGDHKYMDRTLQRAQQSINANKPP